MIPVRGAEIQRRGGGNPPAVTVHYYNPNPRHQLQRGKEEKTPELEPLEKLPDV